MEKASFVSQTKHPIYSQNIGAIVQGPHECGLYLSYVILKVPLHKRQAYVH